MKCNLLVGIHLLHFLMWSSYDGGSDTSVSAVRQARSLTEVHTTACVWEKWEHRDSKKTQSVGLATFTRVYWKEEDCSFGRKEVPVLLVIN